MPRIPYNYSSASNSEKGGQTMNIFLTLQEGPLRDKFFPAPVFEQLNRLGSVRVNETGRTLTEDELGAHLAGVDICITHSWRGIARFSEQVLARADRLQLITHVAGSVAPFATDHVYDRGIKVCSANKIMARFVAEGALAYMLGALRQIPQHEQDMKNGIWLKRPTESLIGKKIALIGLGTVGRYLLEFLKPFEVTVKIYDPYLSPDALSFGAGVELVPTMEEALAWGEIISLHASKTEQTYHMLNAAALALIPDGALLVNTARGALIDEQALAQELQTGRLQAVLDVFEQEPLPAGSPLRAFPHAILQPHCAGDNNYLSYTLGMVEEIRRFIHQEPLQHEIPYRQFKLMTV
jgi:phosphoglycerate dehydrogenase-like enzyme